MTLSDGEELTSENYLLPVGISIYIFSKPSRQPHTARHNTMRFVALVSGGKDSIYATLQAIENGHELACCAHLAPPSQHSLDEESYMYQTAGSEAVRKQVEECMGVPFYVREIRGRSKNISLVYDTAVGDTDDVTTDEVEDLYLLLKQIQRECPDVTAVSSGAILSTYQRTRIEHVCSRLNLTSLSFLWRMSSQRELLNSILDDGQIDAVLVRVACPPGLMPNRHLGKSLLELRNGGVLDQLQNRYGMHPAGEGGEYETLVLDCPRLFKYGRLVLEETEVITDESDDGVGNMKIIKCSVAKKIAVDDHTHFKVSDDLRIGQSRVTEQVQMAKSNLFRDVNDAQIPTTTSAIGSRIHQSMNLPNVRIMNGGLCYISAILSPIASNRLDDEMLAAVEEFLSIRQMLQSILSRLFPGDQPPSSPQDVLYVHLYLSEIKYFAKINHYYQQFFGTQLPPSRSCVAVGRNALPGGRRVMMDCIFQRGSGSYLRHDSSSVVCDKADTFFDKALQNKHHFLRKTLHVQSLSNWAPVCIGPYSQANTLRSSLVFLSGTIGLIPQSMTLIKPIALDVADWEVQLHQSWKNAAAVLDGLEDGGGKLEDCLGGLVYLSAGALGSSMASYEMNEPGFPWQRLWKTAQSICSDALVTNAGVIVGNVDGFDATATDLDPNLYDESGVLYGGYEDEETWREILGPITPSASLPTCVDVPLLMVCLPELPANAEAEVELILASRRAASCLNIRNSSVARSHVPNTGGLTASQSNRRICWDTGYDHAIPPQLKDDQLCVKISSIARFVGSGCASVSTVIARLVPNETALKEIVHAYDFDLEETLSRMIDSSVNIAKSKEELSSLFTIEDVLNVRLYYVAASVLQREHKNIASSNSSLVDVDLVDDGSTLRTQLHSVLHLKSKQYNDSKIIGIKGRSFNIPAFTVVPVLGLHVSDGEDDGVPLMAMQVTLADLVRMETETWVRCNRL
jgi:diphthine-ammonia ligase